MADEEIKEAETPAETQPESGAESEEKVEKKIEPLSAEELEKLTVTKLRELAKDIGGIVGVHAMKKDELLVQIKEAWGMDTTVVVVKKDTRDLKLKISEMRKLKEEARTANDHKRVDILRKKIKRLKRKTRSA